MTTPPLLEPDLATVGDQVLAQLAAVREVLGAVRDQVVRVHSHELASLAAEAAAVVGAAEAARAAVVLEADERGVIAESDHPRASRWVEQSCRDARIPVARGHARQLHDLTTVGTGRDVAALRDAVTEARVPLEAAATVARVYRRLRSSIDYSNWEALLTALVDWAAEGASNRDLAALEDALIGQYGTPNALDDEHAHHHGRRQLTTFHRDRTGMLSATLRLDPASEAVFSAAITSLSAPHLDESGELDAERGHGTTAYGQALSPTEVRLLACDAQIIPAVLGTAGEILELGRSKRLVTPALTAALHLRDGGCTFPGCSAPPVYCDGHHIVYWALGGRTDLSNLALLCRHHHTEVHRRHHHATVGPNGVGWRRRDGAPIGNTPRGPSG